jgi:hypothetical protein
VLARKNHKNRKIRKICEAKAVPVFPFIRCFHNHYVWRITCSFQLSLGGTDTIQPLPEGDTIMDTLRDLLGREKGGAAIDVKDVLLVDREAVKLFAFGRP